MRVLKEVNGVLTDKELSVDRINEIEEYSWINIIEPTEEIVTKICEHTGLDRARMLGSLDLEETAHIDFDGDDLLTVDVPVLNDDGMFETVPYSIMSNDKYFVTMCSKRPYVLEHILSKTKKIEPHKHIRTTLQILYRISTQYIQALRVIDKKRNELEAKINTSTKNQEIFELMNLNKSLVYLSTSLNSNKNVLIKLEKMPEYKKYEADYDLMDDVITENNQAIEMCSIHRQILDGMLNAFATITSNNLNIIMRVLTVITLIIAIPTLVGSVYGMNVKGLPLAEMDGGFWIIMALSVVLAIIGAIFLIKFSNNAIRQRKPRKKDK